MMKYHYVTVTPRAFLPALLSLLFFASALQESNGQPDTDEQGIGFPVNLGPVINSEWAEILPVVSPDGTRLYFSRKGAPENIGGKNDLEDIYYSELGSDGSWGTPVNAGSPLNSTGSDLLFSFSADGKSALVYHGGKQNGKEVGLALTHLVNGKWSEPKKIEIEGVESLGDYYYAFMTGDGEHLFLSYSPTNNYLNLDIYLCRAESDDMMRWSKPVLVEGINTTFIDGSPFLSPDNQMLYLISDRPGGNGLADIYVTRRSGDDWNRWTVPEQLNGYASSPMFESSVSVSPDGKSLYISRVAAEIGAFGRLDIYRASLPETLKLSRSFVLRGKVIDKATGKGIQGRVFTRTQRDTRVISETVTQEDGSFSVALIPGFLFTIRAESEGYSLGGITFDSRNLHLPEEVSPITIELETGKKHVPTTGRVVVLFATGSAAVSATARQSLRRFVDGAKESDGVIEIFGHTDSVGIAENNQQLSTERAQKVKEVLQEMGIASSRMVTTGFGENEPTADNGTVRGRAANRRVEIRISHPEGNLEIRPSSK